MKFKLPPIFLYVVYGFDRDEGVHIVRVFQSYYKAVAYAEIMNKYYIGFYQVEKVPFEL